MDFCQCILAHSFSPSREGHGTSIWQYHLAIFFSCQVNYEKGTSLWHKCLYIYVTSNPKNSCIQKILFHLNIRGQQKFFKIMTQNHRIELSLHSWGWKGDLEITWSLPIHHCHFLKSTVNRRNYFAFYLQCSAYYNKWGCGVHTAYWHRDAACCWHQLLQNTLSDFSGKRENNFWLMILQKQASLTKKQKQITSSYHATSCTWLNKWKQ